MNETAKLGLPLIAAAQAQKHVTHNEAILRLDALVHLAVKDRNLTAPPGAPQDGDRYMPASGATDAWATWDLNIAWFVDGVWTKLVPRPGWRVWVEDEALLLVWNGAAWVEIQAGGVRSAFLAHMDGTDQTGIPPSDFTKLTFPNAEFNIGGHYNEASSKWAPPAGFVIIGANVRWRVGIVDQERLLTMVYKNGVRLRDIASIAASGTANVQSNTGFLFDMADGTDEYEIFVNPGGDGDKTVGGNVWFSYFCGLAL
jgi:hypothetical protein